MERNDKGLADTARMPGPDGTPGEGLTIQQAIAGAEAWWDAKGRKLVRRDFNMEEIGRKVKPGSKGAPAFVIQGDIGPVLHSRILQGRPWEDLTKEEKLSVVRGWYAGVWAPMQIDAAEISREWRRFIDHWYDTGPTDIEDDEIVVKVDLLDDAEKGGETAIERLKKLAANAEPAAVRVILDDTSVIMKLKDLRLWVATL